MRSIYASFICKVNASSMIFPYFCDYPMPLITNRSMRDAHLESQFEPHIDINYYARRNFTKYFNITLCSSYMGYMFMLKFDDIIPLI
jgi:hypothetical protein